MPLLFAIAGLLTGAFLIRFANFLINKNSTLSCPYCRTPYRLWFSLEGLILHRGRCSSCGAPYLVPFAMAEIFTPVIFVLIWLKFNFTLYTLFALFYAAAFMTLFLTDIIYRLIPDAVVYPTVAMAIIGEALKGSRLHAHLLGGVFSLLLFLVFYGLGEVFRRWKSVEEVAFGLGDVKLAFLIGIILGYPLGLKTLLIGILLNGLVALAILLRGIVSKRFNPLAAFPYGPGLIVSFFTFWLIVS